MKKIISTLVAFVMLISCFINCASAEESPAKVEVSLSQEDILTKAADDELIPVGLALRDDFPNWFHYCAEIESISFDEYCKVRNAHFAESNNKAAEALPEGMHVTFVGESTPVVSGEATKAAIKEMENMTDLIGIMFVGIEEIYEDDISSENVEIIIVQEGFSSLDDFPDDGLIEVCVNFPDPDPLPNWFGYQYEHGYIPFDEYREIRREHNAVITTKAVNALPDGMEVDYIGNFAPFVSGKATKAAIKEMEGMPDIIAAIEVGHAEAWPDDTVIGDVNLDGEVTAEDARLALRNSAQLEELDKYQLHNADMDADGKITAADARAILIKSANIR